MTSKTKTISSKAYVLGITKDRLIHDIYTTFYNVISNGISDTQVNARDKYKWILPAWNDDDLTNSGELIKEMYPRIIIESPKIKWDKFTLFNKWSTGTIVFEVYSTKIIDKDALGDSIIKAIENYTPEFRNNLNLKFVNLEDTDDDHYERSSIQIHFKQITFSFKYSFARST